MTINNLTYLKSVSTRLELDGDLQAHTALAQAVIEISMLRKMLADSLDGLVTENDLGDKMSCVVEEARRNRKYYDWL